MLHIRLICVLALQRMIDSRFSGDQWEQLLPKEALNAIGGLVLRASNQAVQWCKFFDNRQDEGEPMKKYFQRCEFQCPSCATDLSQYMLLRKLVVGLKDPVLKREVFQAHGDYAKG